MSDLGELTYPLLLVIDDAIVTYVDSAAALRRILSMTTDKAMADGVWTRTTLVGRDSVATVTELKFEAKAGFFSFMKPRPFKATFARSSGSPDFVLVKACVRRWIERWVKEGDPSYAEEILPQVEAAADVSGILTVLGRR